MTLDTQEEAPPGPQEEAIEQAGDVEVPETAMADFLSKVGSKDEKVRQGAHDRFLMEQQRQSQKDRAQKKAAEYHIKAGRPAGSIFDDPDKLMAKLLQSKRRKTFTGQLGVRLPVISETEDMSRTAEVYKAVQAFDRGNATAEEEEKVVDYLVELQRPSSIGSMTADILSELPAFAGEIALTAGMSTGMRKVAVKGVKESMEYAAERSAKRAIFDALGKSFLASVTTMAPRSIKSTYERALPALDLKLDPENAALVMQGTTKSFLETLPKGVLDTVIENFTEHTGGLFEHLPGVQKIAAVQGAFLKQLLKIDPTKSAGDVLGKIAKATQWQGVLSEFGEERVGDVLKALTLGDNMDPSIDRYLSEITAFAIPGAVATAGRAAGAIKIPEFAQGLENEVKDAAQEVQKNQAEEEKQAAAAAGEPPKEEPKPVIDEGARVRHAVRTRLGIDLGSFVPAAQKPALLEEIRTATKDRDVAWKVARSLLEGGPGRITKEEFAQFWPEEVKRGPGVEEGGPTLEEATQPKTWNVSEPDLVRQKLRIEMGLPPGEHLQPQQLIRAVKLMQDNGVNRDTAFSAILGPANSPGEGLAGITGEEFDQVWGSAELLARPSGEEALESPVRRPTSEIGHENRPAPVAGEDPAQAFRSREAIIEGTKNVMSPGLPSQAKLKGRLQKARAERHGQEARSVDSFYKIIGDLSHVFGVGKVGLGKAKVLKKRALGFFRPSSEEIRMRRGGDIGTFTHELGHFMHKLMFPRATEEKTVKDAEGNVELVYDKRVSKSLSPKDFPEAWRADLHLLGKDLYGNQKPGAGYASEGWAEAVRLLVINPAHLKARTPALYDGLVRTLSMEHPEVWGAIKWARQRTKNVVAFMQKRPLAGLIAHEPIKSRTVRDLWDNLRILLFDRMQRLHTMKLDLGLDPTADRDQHVQALRSMGYISGDSKLMMNVGQFDPSDPGREKTGKSLLEILYPVKENLDLWQEYMLAKRGLEKRAQGYATLPPPYDLPKTISNEALSNFIKEVEALNPSFATASQEFQQFNRWLVREYAVHYGLLTPAAAEKIIEKNLEYITFRHERLEDSSAKKFAGRRAQGFAGQTSGIQGFREGLGERLFPPLEMFLSHMQGIVTNARLNEVAQNITGIAEPDPVTGMMVEGGGRWIAKKDRDIDAYKAHLDQYKRRLAQDLGLKVDENGELFGDIPPWMSEWPADLKEFGELWAGLEAPTFFKPSNRTDKANREVVVLRKGKPTFYEVKDAKLFDLLEGLNNPTTTNEFFKFLRIPGRILRAGATEKNPSFFIPNFMRDAFQAMTMTDTEINRLGEQARGRIIGMREAFRGGEYERMFLASGADMSGLFQEYYDPRTQRIDLDKLFEKPHLLSLVKGRGKMSIAKDIGSLGMLSRLNGAMERATRLGEFVVAYEQALKSGESKATAIAKAGQAAADITLDFQRGGTLSKQINEIIPFFNAAMIGTDKFGRFMAQNPPKALGMIFSMLIMPSLLQLAALWNDPDYWAKPKTERDRYWFFSTGHDDAGHPVYVKIPKPYGLGVFSIVTERMVSRWFGIDPNTGSTTERGDTEALEGLLPSISGGRPSFGAILREFLPSANIAGLLPMMEVLAGPQGWSFYRDREIVSTAERDLPVRMQGASRSSELAKFIADLAPGEGWAPAKIDYLIQGWFGGLGRDLTQLMIDPILPAREGAEHHEPMEPADWPVIRRFIAGANFSQDEAITRFYRQYESLRRVHAGITPLKDTPARAIEYMNAHRPELALWNVYSKAQRDMSEVFRELRGLYRRPLADPEQNDQRIDHLYELIVRRARDAYSTRALAEKLR